MRTTARAGTDPFGEVSPHLDGRDRQLIEAALAFASAREEPLKIGDFAALDRAELLAIADLVVAVQGELSAGIPQLLQEERSLTYRIRVGDHQTSVVDIGSGDTPLVLIHSLGLDWRMSRDMLPRLAQHGRVLAYDLRLHGVATNAPLDSFTLETCADDLARLLDALSLDSAHVVGFSLGGAVAQVFALRHPARLKALGLVCTMATSNGSTYLERARSAELHGMETQVAPTMQRWFNTPELAKNDWAVRYAREQIRRVPPERWARYWRGLNQVHTLDQLDAIAVPTTVIAGGDDRSTPPDSMQSIAASIPQAAFHVVPEAPHMIGLTAPEAVARLISNSRCT